jgi:hypothetical protein
LLRELPHREVIVAWYAVILIEKSGEHLGVRRGIRATPRATYAHIEPRLTPCACVVRLILFGRWRIRAMIREGCARIIMVRMLIECHRSLLELARQQECGQWSAFRRVSLHVLRINVILKYAIWRHAWLVLHR